MNYGSTEQLSNNDMNETTSTKFRKVVGQNKDTLIEVETAQQGRVSN